MLRTLLACGVIGIACAADAGAQMVRIGPFGGVSIRVPFVSVDVDPWGGTRVRAPFTAVDTPGHGYYGYHDHNGPHYGYPLYDVPTYSPYSLPYERYSEPYYPYSTPYRPYAAPTPQYDAAPRSSYSLPDQRSGSLADPGAGELELPYSPYDADWLRSQQSGVIASGGSSLGIDGGDDPVASLATAAARLDRSLQGRSDGQVWLDYLQTDRIAAIASSPAPLDTAELRRMLDNFDGVTANDSLRWVTRLDGFAETRRLLRQLTSPDRPSTDVQLEPATDRQRESSPTEPSSDVPSEPSTGGQPETESIDAEELPPPAPEPSETPTRFEA